MKTFVLTPLAARDLGEIWDYVAANNIDVADRVLAAIENAIQRLVRYPGIGHQREELADLRLAEHDRQGLRHLGRGDERDHGPVALEADLVQEPEGCHGDGDRAGRQLPLGGQVDLIGADLFGPQALGGLSEVAGELGYSEAEIAAELEYRMRRLGAERPAFETIVAAGARSALPHAQPTGSRVQANQLVLVDMGASREGYASDMTRMAFLGRPGRKVRDLYSSVLEAQLAAIDAVRPGVPAGNVDRAARRVLRAHGLGKAFVHSTGHGLGLEIHEAPRLAKGPHSVVLAAALVVEWVMPSSVVTKPILGAPGEALALAALLIGLPVALLLSRVVRLATAAELRADRAEAMARDTTLGRDTLPVTLRFPFDVQVGRWVVRLVARDGVVFESGE